MLAAAITKGASWIHVRNSLLSGLHATPFHVIGRTDLHRQASVFVPKPHAQLWPFALAASLRVHFRTNLLKFAWDGSATACTGLPCSCINSVSWVSVSCHLAPPGRSVTRCAAHAGGSRGLRGADSPAGVRSPHVGTSGSFWTEGLLYPAAVIAASRGGFGEHACTSFCEGQHRRACVVRKCGAARPMRAHVPCLHDDHPSLRGGPDPNG